MDWKEFFKFSGKKILILAILIVLSFFIKIITVFAIMDVTSIAAIILLFISQMIAPFSLVPIIGWILNLIYFYLLSCIFLYAIGHPEKRKFFVLIGVSLILIIGSLSATHYYLWNKDYVTRMNKQMAEYRNGPYGALEYPNDLGIYANAKTMISYDRFDSALRSCNQLNPEATFNNGENIKEECLCELQAKKG